MRVALSILPLFWLGCTVGDGSGSATGTVSLPACHMEGEFDLDPDFFGGERFEDTLSITLQRSGDYQVKSDGLVIVVPDIGHVDDHLGDPLQVGFEPDASLPEISDLIRASLYLNRSCAKDEDGGLVAVGGSVTFSSVGEGTIDEDDVIAGEFDLDLAEVQGGEGWAHLAGYFRFRYTRGRPAQRFP